MQKNQNQYRTYAQHCVSPIISYNSVLFHKSDNLNKILLYIASWDDQFLIFPII